MLLETERLIIRPFVMDDLPQFVRLLDVPEVPGWQMQKANPKAFLEWQIANSTRMDIVRGSACFGIFDKRTGRVLGAVGAGEHDDLHEPEISYSLLPDSRGKGYATEATGAVTDWAFRSYDIPYLIGTVEVGNEPSRRVLERCGFHYVDKRDLLVHITNQTHEFWYFRRYRDVTQGDSGKAHGGDRADLQGPRQE